MIGKVLRALVLIVVIGALAPSGSSLAPPAASAAQFDLWSCHRQSNDEGQSAAGWSYRGVLVYMFSRCPDGQIFGTDQTLSEGALLSWTFTVGWLKLDSVRFLVDGGDTSGGIEYSIATCEGCQQMAVLPHRTPESPLESLEYGLDGGQQFMVRATCKRPVCYPSESIKIFNFEFKASDDQPPEIGQVIGSYPGWTGSRPMYFDDWNRPIDVGASFSVHDIGVGMGVASMDIDGVRTLWDRGRCTVLYVQSWTPYCRSLGPFNFDGPINVFGLPDGWHTMNIRAVDAIGNTATTKTLWFAIDGTPPPEPSQLTASGIGEHGWTSATSHRLNWVNDSETTLANPDPDRLATSSGITFAWMDVRPIGTGQPDPDPQRQYGVNIQSLSNVSVPSDGIWAIDVWTEDAVGNQGDKAHVEIKRDQDAPTAPELDGAGWISRDQLIDGYEMTWNRPANLAEIESGICGYNTALAGSQGLDTPKVINLAGDKIASRLAANAPEGTNWFYLRAISCSGRASEAASTAVRVDATAPVVGLSGLPAGQWATQPLSLKLVASDPLSGVGQVFYSVDDAPFTTVAADSATIAVGDGVHVVRYGATDATGNSSVLSAVTVRVDSHAPDAWFDPRSRLQPVTVVASVNDTLAGVASARIEYRRVDAGALAEELIWRTIGAVIRPGPTDNRELLLTARLPDERLRDGSYALRIVASDIAGNAVTTSGTRPDGSDLRIELPARERLRLSAAVARPSRPGKASQNLVIGFSDSAVVVGQLRRATGAPVPGAIIKIYSAQLGGHAQFLGEAVTAGDGSYRHRLPPGPSRIVTTRFAGSDTEGAIEQSVTLGVRAGVILAQVRGRARMGRTIVARGRLLGGGVELPPRGKLVQLEGFLGGAWSPLSRVRPTDASGRFAITFRIPRSTRSTRSARTLRVRVYVPFEDSWPFEAAGSRERHLRLRR